jgi:hypothetical protein
MVWVYRRTPVTAGVQINGENPVCRGGNDGGDEFRRNRHRPRHAVWRRSQSADNRNSCCAFQAIKINQRLDEVYQQDCVD